jgi:cytochrome c biogenesis protein CcmG/thiol:disulfide interchange protein DsbE
MLNSLLNNSPVTEDSGGARLGKAAPDFSLVDFNGQPLRLADLQGKGVVLNFWASWCEPCHDEAPSLNAAYAKYKDKGIAFIGINFWNQQETEADARAFAQRYGVPYTLARDTDGDTSLRYGVSGLPVTFFIDETGTVVRRWVGPLDEENLDSLIVGISPQT